MMVMAKIGGMPLEEVFIKMALRHVKLYNTLKENDMPEDVVEFLNDLFDEIVDDERREFEMINPAAMIA